MNINDTKKLEQENVLSNRNTSRLIKIHSFILCSIKNKLFYKY